MVGMIADWTGPAIAPEFERDRDLDASAACSPFKFGAEAAELDGGKGEAAR